MTNSLLSIYCALTLVALGQSRQLSYNMAQYFNGPSLATSQKIDKSLPKQGMMMVYLTPNEMKALQEAQDMSNAQLEAQLKKMHNDFQAYNERQHQQNQLKSYQVHENLPEEGEEPKVQLRGLLSHNSFYPEETVSYEDQENKYSFVNLNVNQKMKEAPKQNSSPDLTENSLMGNYQYQESSNNQTNIKSTKQEESEWIPINPELPNQEKDLLHEKLQEHWNRILDHNRIQLKELSTNQKNNQNEQTQNEEEEKAEKMESTSKNYQKTEVEKQIDAILANNRVNYDLQGLRQTGPLSQTPPIIIHKEVSVTRHLPIHVVKHVKVPVPTPVLVPVPEPYEVKVPHPYPVPMEIIKHIPVPVVKHYSNSY